MSRQGKGFFSTLKSAVASVADATHQAAFVATMKSHGIRGQTAEVLYSTLNDDRYSVSVSGSWYSYKQKKFSDMLPLAIFAWVLSQLNPGGQSYLVKQVGHHFLVGENGFANLCTAILRMGHFVDDNNKQSAIKQVREALKGNIFRYMSKRHIIDEIKAGRAGDFRMYVDDSPSASAKIFFLYNQYYEFLGHDAFVKNSDYFRNAELSEKDVFFYVYSNVAEQYQKNFLQLLLEKHILQVLLMTSEQAQLVLSGNAQPAERVTVSSVDTENTEVVVSPGTGSEVFACPLPESAVSGEEGDDQKSYNYDDDSFETYSSSEADHKKDGHSISTEDDEEDEEDAIDIAAENLSRLAIEKAQKHLLVEKEEALRKNVELFLEGIFDAVESNVEYKKQVARARLEAEQVVLKHQASQEITEINSNPVVQVATNDVTEFAVQPEQSGGVEEEELQANKLKSDEEVVAIDTTKRAKAKGSPLLKGGATWAAIPIPETPASATSIPPVSSVRKSSWLSFVGSFVTKPFKSSSQSSKDRLFTIYLDLLERGRAKKYSKAEVVALLAQLEQISPVEAFSHVYSQLKTRDLKEPLIKRTFPFFADQILTCDRDYIQLYERILSECANDNFEQEFVSGQLPVALLLVQLGESNFKFFATREGVFKLLGSVSQITLTNLENYVKAQKSRSTVGEGAGELFYLYHQYVSIIGMFEQHIYQMSMLEQNSFFQQQLKKLDIKTTDSEYDIFFKIAEFMLSTYNKAFLKAERDRDERDKFILEQTQGYRIRGRLDDLLSSCKKIILDGRDLEEVRQRLAKLEVSVPYELSRVTTYEELLVHIQKYDSLEKKELFSFYSQLLEADDQRDYLAMLKDCAGRSHCDAFIAVYKKLGDTDRRKKLIAEVFPGFADNILTSRGEYIKLYVAMSPVPLPQEPTREATCEAQLRQDELGVLVDQLDNKNFEGLDTREDYFALLKGLAAVPEVVRSIIARFPEQKFLQQREDELTLKAKIFYLYSQYYNLIGTFKPGWERLSGDTQYQYFIDQFPNDQPLSNEYAIFHHLWTVALPKLQREAAAESDAFAKSQTGIRVTQGSLIPLLLQFSDILEVDADKLVAFFSSIPFDLPEGTQLRKQFTDKIKESRFFASDIKQNFLIKTDQLPPNDASRQQRGPFAKDSSGNHQHASAKRVKPAAKIIESESLPRRQLQPSEDSRVSTSASSVAAETVTLSEDDFLQKWGINEEEGNVLQKGFSKITAQAKALVSTEQHEQLGRDRAEREIAKACFNIFQAPELIQVGQDKVNDASKDAAHQEVLKSFKQHGFVYDESFSALELSNLKNECLKKLLWTILKVTRGLRNQLISEIFPKYTQYLITSDPADFIALMRLRRSDRQLSDAIIKQLGTKFLSFPYVEKNPHIMMQMIALCMMPETRKDFVRTEGCPQLFVRYALYCDFVEDSKQFDRDGILHRKKYDSEETYFEAIKNYVKEHAQTVRYNKFCQRINQLQANVAASDQVNRESVTSADSRVSSMSTASEVAYDFFKAISHTAHQVAAKAKAAITTTVGEYIDKALKQRPPFYRVYVNALWGNTDKNLDINSDSNQGLKQSIDDLLSPHSQRTESETFCKVYGQLEPEQQPKLIEAIFPAYDEIILCNADAIDGLQGSLRHECQERLKQKSAIFSGFIEERKQLVQEKVNEILTFCSDQLGEVADQVKVLYTEYAKLFIDAESLWYVNTQSVTSAISAAKDKIRNCIGAGARDGSVNDEMKVFAYVCGALLSDETRSAVLINQILPNPAFFSIIFGQYQNADEFNDKKAHMLQLAQGQGVSHANCALIDAKIDVIEQARQNTELAQMVSSYEQLDSNEITRLNDIMDEIIARLERYQTHLNKQDDQAIEADFDYEDHLFRDYEDCKSFSEPDFEGALFCSFDEKELASGFDLKERKRGLVKQLIEQAQKVKEVLNQDPAVRTDNHVVTLKANFDGLKQSFETNRNILSKHCDIGRILVGAIAILLVLPAVMLAIHSKMNTTRNTFNFFKTDGSAMADDISSALYGKRGYF